METAISYLLQSAAGVATLSIAYRLLLTKQPWFGIRRLILLTIIVFGFAGPFVASAIFSISGTGATGLVAGEYSIRNLTIQLAEITISPNTFPEYNMTLFQILSVVYFTGVIIFSFRFLVQGYRLFRLFKKSEKVKQNGMTFVLLKEGSPAFSFFNFIFLDKDLYSMKENPEHIIRHETVHVRQMHSIDIILVEMLIIVQWFNPFIYLLKRSVVENNEFLADRKMAKQFTDVSDYKLLLLNNALPKETWFQTNNFSYSLIKKRFKMMEKEKSKMRLILSTLGFLVVFALVTVSCSNDKGTEITDLQTKQKSAQAVEKATTPEDTVFTVVEKMPEFPGGMNGLMKFLTDNIKYPEVAKNNNIQGRVFVNFVIEKDGSVSHLKILRGIGGGCDEEAIRVVKMMPRWTPGEQRGEKVRVSYNLPIKFSLE